MRIGIELWCILFPLIILEMFLQLDWSPPVVNSIDWTWFGKAHTPDYIRSHSWQCMSDQKPNHEVEIIVRRAPRHDCVEIQIWGRVPKHFCSIEGLQEHSGPIIFKWEKFGTTQTFPRAGLPAKMSNRGRSALVREVTKNRWLFLCGDGRTLQKTTISEALHQSGLYGRVTRRKSLLSKRQYAWRLPKGT